MKTLAILLILFCAFQSMAEELKPKVYSSSWIYARPGAIRDVNALTNKIVAICNGFEEHAFDKELHKSPEASMTQTDAIILGFLHEDFYPWNGEGYAGRTYRHKIGGTEFSAFRSEFIPWGIGLFEQKGHSHDISEISYNVNHVHYYKTTILDIYGSWNNFLNYLFAKAAVSAGISTSVDPNVTTDPYKR